MDKLIDTLKVIAMSRGTVIVDENLRSVGPYLTDANIRVRMPPQGMEDKQIAREYLPNRIFITNNSKDFIRAAIKYDIGIIATENIQSKDPELLADLISDVLIDFSLWSERTGFLLTLMNDGKHEFKRLTDASIKESKETKKKK